MQFGVITLLSPSIGSRVKNGIALGRAMELLERTNKTSPRWGDQGYLTYKEALDRLGYEGINGEAILSRRVHEARMVARMKRN